MLVDKCKKYDDENSQLERLVDEKDREIEFLKRKYLDIRVHHIMNNS